MFLREKGRKWYFLNHNDRGTMASAFAGKSHYSIYTVFFFFQRSLYLCTRLYSYCKNKSVLRPCIKQSLYNRSHQPRRKEIYYHLHGFFFYYFNFRLCYANYSLHINIFKLNFHIILIFILN